MTILWGIFWGYVLGSLWSGSGNFASLFGSIVGAIAGLSLRFVIDLQISRSTDKLRAQLLAQIKALEIRLNSVPSELTTETPRSAGTDVDFDKQTSEVVVTRPVTSSLSVADQTNRSQIPDLQQQAEQVVDKSIVQEPERPPSPSALGLAFQNAKNWFLGGNTIVRTGLVILFIGLSFLARYAAAAGLLPPEVRLVVIGSIGIVLLVIGFKKRLNKPGFGLALQGAGVAIMYLTVFAAFKLYNLVPSLAAFGLMIVVCALSCALALLQNSRALAMVAFAGGFAVPILLSTGQGSHIGLFSYYTILNLAILFIAYRRSWRILNVLGFVATFGIATFWGVLKYIPEQYASTQPFLLGFLFIYAITAVLYARNTPTKLGNAVDSTLVFGTPLIAFGLQAGLVKHFELGTAFSAMGFAALYLGLATVLTRYAFTNYRLLIECFIAIGVGFATLAVPLALDAKWTSAVWALEGAGAFWVGMRQSRWMPRAFGLCLQVIAVVSYMSGLKYGQVMYPVVNAMFIGAILIAIPAMLISWWLRKDLPSSESNWAITYSSLEKKFSTPLFIYGFVWWCAALVGEIDRGTSSIELVGYRLSVFSQSTTQLLMMVGIVASAWLSQFFGLTKGWAVATWPSRATLAVMVVTLLAQISIQANVLHSPAWLVWTIVLFLHYWMQRANDLRDLNKTNAAQQKITYYIHVGSVWLVTVILADCLWLFVDTADLWNTDWASVVLLISAIGILMVLSLWAGRANHRVELVNFKWPLNPHALAYYWHAAMPLVLMVFVGAIIVAMTSSGRTDPLPYIPLLNPTDLSLALAISALMFWQRKIATAMPAPVGSTMVLSYRYLVAISALAFIAINTVWLRVAHNFFGVHWDATSLFNSFVVQTGYAILWTLFALSMMLVAGRRKLRMLWLIGAGLLGAVVLKLMLIDLSNAGGAERIIAFIAVGAMMLIVGYLAPLPPKHAAITNKNSTN
ncbi:MAG TPA: DUF2339 domain-containing protein [Burkholderiaceae bacterium]|nr:DUF2339 domain-containing protein [Burkholderiaceae bacterium]